MADPWSSDLAALGEHSRRGLRTLEATHAALAQRPQETKMRFFKNHPALAAVIALAVLALAAPIAYAVVREVWVSIDPDKPASEIEKDVSSQLEAAGVQGSVHAEKSDDGKLQLSIQSSDVALGSGLHISVGGKDATMDSRTLRLEIACEGGTADEPCSNMPEQLQAVMKVVAGDDMIAVLKHDYASDGELIAAIVAVFHAHGYANVTVTRGDGGLTARVELPPT